MHGTSFFNRCERRGVSVELFFLFLLLAGALDDDDELAGKSWPFRLSNMYRTGTKVLIPLVCVTSLGVR